MSDNITIRNARIADLEHVYRFICELENDMLDFGLFQKIHEGNLNNPDCHYYIAENKNLPVGFISMQVQKLLHHCGKVGEIQEFFVDQQYRNMGIGRLMVNEVIKYADEMSLKSLEVTSNKKRSQNVAIYEQLGFKLTHNKFTL